MSKRSSTTNHDGPDAGVRKGTGVVVGIDGSDHALGALHFAAEEAQRRQLPLTLVTTYTLSPYAINAAAYGAPIIDELALQEECARLLEDAKTGLTQDLPEVHVFVEYGDATKVLLSYSKSADVLVVGSRGRGGFTGQLLGSTSAGLISHSKAPVIVIPRKFTRAQASGEHRDDDAPVSVGVDGSRHSLAAALEAARAASLRGSHLRLVGAMPPPAHDLSWVPLDDQITVATNQLSETLKEDVEWLRAIFPSVSIGAVVVYGSSVETLVAETKSAPLTVVGTRGRGGFAGLLLGSTSNGLLHQAEGPVLVVGRDDYPELADHPRLREDATS